MAKSDQLKNTSKGNSEDSLLVVYILQILRKYSSPKKPLSAQDIMEYLKDEYSIGFTDKDKSNAQKKKVRRHLDTLHDYYGNGCIYKEEGKTRNGHKWFYDASRDKFANEDGRAYETLSDVELEFIIDLISATKILNAESTLGMVDKLMKKTSLSDEDRKRRLNAILKEGWTKNPNDDLVVKKEIIQSYIDVMCRISFDYEGKKTVLATPCGWLYTDGKCILNAKVEGEYHQFLLDKIRNVEEVDDYDDGEDYGYYDEDNPSNSTSLDSLFGNIPFINTAIKEKREIKFKYLSYVVKNDRVIFEENAKNVLPHSLVFNDGKYYLIGIDEDATYTNKIGYFRVDLIVDLDYSETKIKLSDWNKYVYETIQRAREVEKHPLMVAGQDIKVDFMILESALDRVRDAYGTSPKFQVTKETKIMPIDLSKQKWDENHSIAEFPREKLVKVSVRTTREEAFRWALANADAVELVYPSDLRHELRRIADPIKKTYAMTMEDRVQENIDHIFESGLFRISRGLGKDVAFKTFKNLDKNGNTDIVRKIYVSNFEVDQENYLGCFTDAEWLTISLSQCKEPLWASSLVNLVHIELFKTLIENVSWLEGMNKLKFVQLNDSPIRDLSVLRNHKNITMLDISNTNVYDISFVENYRHLLKLDIRGCPIEDYAPLLKIPPLDILKIDENAVKALGMDNLVKHHPDAVIEVQQKINNRKV